jgi:hypothetical protein
VASEISTGKKKLLHAIPVKATAARWSSTTDIFVLVSRPNDVSVFADKLRLADEVGIIITVII